MTKSIHSIIPRIPPYYFKIMQPFVSAPAAWAWRYKRHITISCKWFRRKLSFHISGDQTIFYWKETVTNSNTSSSERYSNKSSQSSGLKRLTYHRCVTISFIDLSPNIIGYGIFGLLFLISLHLLQVPGKSRLNVQQIQSGYLQ